MLELGAQLRESLATRVTRNEWTAASNMGFEPHPDRDAVLGGATPSIPITYLRILNAWSVAFPSHHVSKSAQ